MFFDEFPNFLENSLQFQDELYISGDFNIHLDKPSVNTRSLLDILDTLSLHQHVTFPTHIYGHWLDLFITRLNCKHAKAVSSSDGLSDHLTVLIDLWLQIKSFSEKANITFRPINKIDLDTLHMDLSNDHSRDFPEPPHVENTMDQFTHTTTSEVRSIILISTNASCDLDQFPTRLLKHYIDDLIVPITAIINLSMREGVVTPDFKQALVTPLIKKKTLCRNEFNNYRPISNLSFLSKILDKMVAKRLNAHIEEHLLSNHV